MSFTVRLFSFGSEEYRQSLALRTKVLREPLGLQFSKEELDRDSSDIHVGAFLQNVLMGCLILTRLSEDTVKMRQVAVASEYQGLGVGRKLVHFSEEIMRQQDCKEMVLNSRQSAIQFYQKLDYEVMGAPFEEVKIVHQKMSKRLGLLE